MVEIFHEASVQRKTANLHDALEDGTLPFHSIMALGCAFDVHKKLYGSMKKISKHTLFLANRLYRGMQKLRYSNGRQVCEIYNDEASAVPYTIAATQGATIAFNVIDSQGTLLGHALIEQLASQKNIFLRAGGLCNPGGIATYLKLERKLSLCKVLVERTKIANFLMQHGNSSALFPRATSVEAPTRISKSSLGNGPVSFVLVSVP